jgi:GNAT superfamily N-acetyltransferase
MHLSDLKLIRFHKNHLKDVSQIQTFVYPPEYQESLSDLEIVYDRRDCYGSCIISDTDELIGYCLGFHIDPFDVLPVIQDPCAGIGTPTRPKQECPVFIYDCVVHPDYQGYSLGTRLVHQFIKDSRSKGFSRIWAVAVDALAISFWDKNGFMSASSDFLPQTKMSDNDQVSWNSIESMKSLPDIYNATGIIYKYHD